jgi:hypothetical protein
MLEQLMAQGVVAQANPQALASLICGGLADPAFWIAEDEGHAPRPEQALDAMELMLKGLRNPC